MLQKHSLKHASAKLVKAVGIAAFSLALLVEGCARQPSSYIEKTKSSNVQVENKTAYAKPEAKLEGRSATLTDTKGAKHTVDLSEKMKPSIGTLAGGRWSFVDSDDGTRTYAIYPPNSNASFMIFLSPDGKERVVAGPPMR